VPVSEAGGPVVGHAIAPARVQRGPGAWSVARTDLAALCSRPLLLGRSAATASLRSRLGQDLRAAGLDPIAATLRRDCCEDDLQRVRRVADAAAVDGVVAAGGGKVLDAGKLLAQRLSVPCITVPLSAATCAGWTALSNLYSPQGAFLGDVSLERCPDLLVFDHDLLRKAPQHTLASGIGDAMAKWYEASVSSGASDDGLVHQAVQQARLLRDQLLLDAPEAMAHPGGPAWARVVEACGLTAGLIGGLGGARCRTVAAHAVHNGLTHVPSSHRRLHGEKVAFGILIQLTLEEQLGGRNLAGQARRQLVPLFQALGLPTRLEDLGLTANALPDLQRVCRVACAAGSDLHHLPFPVSETDLLQALQRRAGDAAAPEPRCTATRSAARP
jgi:glycerol dehydrogenase